MNRIDLDAYMIPLEYVAELERRSLLLFPLRLWPVDLAYETMARYEIDATGSRSRRPASSPATEAWRVNSPPWSTSIPWRWFAWTPTASPH